MTGLVKNYITRKIREGVEPKFKKLREAKAKAEAESVSTPDFKKMIHESKEYKALEQFIRNLAKKNGIEIVGPNTGTPLMNVTFCTNSCAVQKANDAFWAFEDKVKNTVQDTLVGLELSKSKENVDAVIARAIEQLAKAK